MSDLEWVLSDASDADTKILSDDNREVKIQYNRNLIIKKEGLNCVKISEILNKPQRTIMRYLTNLREKGLIEYIGSLKMNNFLLQIFCCITFFRPN